MSRRVLSIDLETYSDVDLPNCGVYRYVEGDFHILLFAYAFDDEETKCVDMACGEQLPAEVMDAEDGDLTLWINSPGGNVFAAAEIYTMIRDYPHNVTVRIASIAASAASVIAMAGNTVQMSPTALLMIHDPSTIAFGNAKDMEKAITTLNEVKESIINAYAAKTGLSRNRISKLMSDETWINAKKAVELGFADEILFDEKPEPDKKEDDPDDPDEPDKPDKEGGDDLWSLLRLTTSKMSSQRHGKRLCLLLWLH